MIFACYANYGTVWELPACRAVKAEQAVDRELGTPSPCSLALASHTCCGAGTEPSVNKAERQPCGAGGLWGAAELGTG